MTNTKPPQNLEFLAILATLTHGRSDTLTAALLGVPVPTLRKWVNGTRSPSASAVRLVSVLATLATVAPGLLEALTPSPAAIVGKKNVHVEKVPSKSL